MEAYHILTDTDVQAFLSMDVAVSKMKDAFIEQAEGNLVAPPRHSVGGPDGSLVFTIGAATKLEKVIGFRVYDTFPDTSRASDQAQIVAVYEYGSGRFKGLVIGRLLGAMRTGAIGGVAMDYLSREDATNLVVIGTGFQAKTQILAAQSVRNITRIILYNRTLSNATRLADEIANRFQLQVEVAESIQEAVSVADIVICATKSPRPILETAWIRPGTFVSTIGPKTVLAHEIPIDLVEASATIATDSLVQAQSIEPSFFIEDLDRVVGLDQIVAGHCPPSNKEDITLFCSVGLAGTEVILANELLSRVGR